MSGSYWALPLARRIHLSDEICIVTLRDAASVLVALGRETRGEDKLLAGAMAAVLAAAQEGRPMLIRRATRLVSLQIIQASLNASLPTALPN